MSEHEYGRAMLEFQSAVKVKPDDSKLYYQLLLAQLSAGQTVAAAVSGNPDQRSGSRGAAFGQLTDPNVAFCAVPASSSSVLQTALKQNPNLPEAKAAQKMLNTGN
jgi:hypothetical protein